MAAYETGLLVRHPRCPEWGLGKVVAVAGPNVSVFFRGVPGTTTAEVVKTINVQRLELEVVTEQSDPWLNNIAVDRMGKLLITRRRVPFAEPLDRFLTAYPLGFADPTYESGPRAAALHAIEEYRATLGGDPEALANDGALEEAFSRTLGAAESARLLPAAEAAAMRSSLASRPTAKSVLTALRRLTRIEQPERRSFDTYLESVCDIAPDRKGRTDAWPAATVLPFLARPDLLGVLRSEETRTIAEMLTFRLRFDPTPNWNTYGAYLRLGNALRSDLAENGLVVRDWIDLQCFVWQAGTAPTRPKTKTRLKAAATTSDD